MAAELQGSDCLLQTACPSGGRIVWVIDSMGSGKETAGFNFSSVASSLCDLGHIIQPLCASAPPSVKWDHERIDTTEAGGFNELVCAYKSPYLVRST